MEKKTFYRIQNGYGEGPYISTPPFNFNHSAQNGHPTVWGCDVLNGFGKKYGYDDAVFGFESMDLLKAWFNDDERIEMMCYENRTKKHQYNIVKIESSKFVNFENQSVFIPESEPVILDWE